jgi:hypothetical protein
MQQLPIFNFGLTKIFFLFTPHSVCGKKPKTIELRGQTQNFYFILLFSSHIPIWVWFVQKTPAKNSHAWTPLKVPKREIFVTELIILSHPIWIGDLRNEPKNRFV